ncbi:SCO family protein [Aquifex pyrophilus]
MRALSLLLITILLLIGCKNKKEFNGVLYDKPAYNFCLKTEEEGKVKEVCLKDILKEKDIVLVFFGYTHCPDVCPAAMYTLKKTMEKLDEDEKKRVQVVFISVDPERDTPELASRYAKYFDKSFLGLTGTPEEIKEVAKHYKVFYKKVQQKDEKNYLVDHTALIYLITKDGKIKLIYSTSRQKPELIAEDIKNLL